MTTPATPATVENILPDTLTGDRVIALPAEVLDQCRQLVTSADAAEVTDQETMEQADAVYAEIDSLAKEIERQRKEITKPLDDLKKAIMAVVKDATEPMSKSRHRLGLRITVYVREQKRKAEEERRRIESERQAEIRRQQEERERREREAQEAADLLGGDPEPITDPEPEPEAPPMPAVAEIKSISVTTVTRREARIADLGAFLTALATDDETHGPPGCLFKKQLVDLDSIAKAVDRKALRVLAVDAGIQLPGVVVDEREDVRRKGRR